MADFNALSLSSAMAHQLAELGLKSDIYYTQRQASFTDVELKTKFQELRNYNQKNSLIAFMQYYLKECVFTKTNELWWLKDRYLGLLRTEEKQAAEIELHNIEARISLLSLFIPSLKHPPAGNNLELILNSIQSDWFEPSNKPIVEFLQKTNIYLNNKKNIISKIPGFLRQTAFFIGIMMMTVVTAFVLFWPLGAAAAVGFAMQVFHFLKQYKHHTRELLLEENIGCQKYASIFLNSDLQKILGASAKERLEGYKHSKSLITTTLV